MIKELLYKWFGLDPVSCPTCEVLKEQLSIERQFNKTLFTKLLEKDKPELPPLPENDEIKPIIPQYVPWRVRQQMLETEDRKTAELKRKKKDEIDALEKELGIAGKQIEKELGVSGTDGIP